MPTPSPTGSATDLDIPEFPSAFEAADDSEVAEVPLDPAKGVFTRLDATDPLASDVAIENDCPTKEAVPTTVGFGALNISSVAVQHEIFCCPTRSSYVDCKPVLQQ